MARVSAGDCYPYRRVFGETGPVASTDNSGSWLQSVIADEVRAVVQVAAPSPQSLGESGRDSLRRRHHQLQKDLPNRSISSLLLPNR